MKRIFTLLLLLPTMAWGAVGFDNAGTCLPGGTGTSCTQAFTVGSGSDRLLTVGVCVRDGAASASGVTYAGIAMTSYANVLRAGTQRLQIFRLVAPASGANDVVVTMDADSPFSVGFASYTGVDPTVPIGTSANDTGGGTLATVDVTSAAGELVFDYTCVDDGTGTAPALSVGAGQTAQVNFSTSFGVPGFERAIASSTEAGAATVTMSWTDGAANSWVIIGGPLMPAAAPAPSSTRQRVVILLP